MLFSSLCGASLHINMVIFCEMAKKKTDQMSNAVPSIGACSDIVLLSFYFPVFSLFIYISINLFFSLLWTFWKSGSLSKMEDLGEAQNFISMTIT